MQEAVVEALLHKKNSDVIAGKQHFIFTAGHQQVAFIIIFLT